MVGAAAVFQMNWIGPIAMVLVAVFLFWAGDTYGRNARLYAEVVAAARVRNADLQRLNQSQSQAAEDEARRFAASDKAFQDALRSVGQCILTKAQAEALNLITD